MMNTSSKGIDEGEKGREERERERGGREREGRERGGGGKEREIKLALILSSRRRSDINTAGSMNRLGALEARATKRAKLGQMLYLPVIFIGYGLLLGKCV